ncbi:MAG TPA: UMP kinase, partial [Thermoplasmata archaeon]|nr:UMP kinase [Thermoplasmata archaeon]
MEKVVVSLGGSVLVPGENDAHHLRALSLLLGDLSKRAKLFVVTGGGRIARYYIETGRAVGIGERTLDEFGIAVTRLNGRLLAATLAGRANRDPVTSYAEAVRLARRYPIVIMAGTRPGHTTDRVSASLARFVRATRIVNATSVDGVYTADPKKNRDAKLIERMQFADLIRIAGRGHVAAGPSIVFDPVA